jgi:hypothetical protein
MSGEIATKVVITSAGHRTFRYSSGVVGKTKFGFVDQTFHRSNWIM